MGENHPLNVAVIIGSTREERFGPVPARWIAERAHQHGAFTVDLVDLKETALPENLGGDTDTWPQIRALGERIDAADAFIVVTPVYNRGYPAPLKTAIDTYHAEWAAKPVGFVSYGGLNGGLYAVEQLRQVFTELHATTIRDTISFANFWEKFDEKGETVEGEPLETAAKNFLDSLAWWAGALRTARRQDTLVALARPPPAAPRGLLPRRVGQSGDGCTQRPGVRVAGGVQDAFRGAFFHEDPAAHHRRAFAQPRNDGEIVGDQQVGQAAFRAQAGEQPQDRVLHGHIQRAGGLIKDQHPRFQRQGAGDR
jgi:NAD(P)H-dependent FMN reductase